VIGAGRLAGALALGVTLGAGAETRVAEAQPAPVAPLALTIEGCPELDQPRLRKLVAIEMATVGGAAANARVRLTCAGGMVAIEVAGDEAAGEGASPAPPARVELNLAAAAEATRLRLLALTITELVAPGASGARAAPPPAAASRDTRAAGVVVRPAEPVGARPLHFFAGASVRRMGRPAAWLGGVAVGATRDVTDFAALALELRGETGDASTSLARVDWQQLVLTGSVALGVAGERWAVHALPGWSVGFARLSARPDAPDARGGSLTGAWSGPSLGLRARRSLGRAAFVSLDVAGGAVTRRVVGLVDGASPIFEIAGPWALAGLSAGATF
jgi:hypothetical protein